MNIAFLDFDDIQNPLLNAGQAKATFEVGRRLAKMGYAVTVYSSRYPGYRDRTENGIFYKHIALGTGNIRLNNAAFILSAPFTVRNIKADIIIESFTAPVSTLYTPLFTRVPVIGLPSMFNAREFYKKYHLPFHLIEKFGCRFYKYFLPYSKIDSEKMRAVNPGVIYQITPQGVGNSFFNIRHKIPKHILFLSRLDIQQKGIDLLIKAYAVVKDQILYPLIIAGHGTDEKRIQEMIRQYSLEKQVSMVGPAYGKKKEELISESSYVVFPSRHDEQPLWVLEALASGLPLVCFDLPESYWITKKVSLKAKPFDIVEYAQKLLQATNPGLNQQMRAEARILAKNYTWDKVAQSFNNFFSKVLEHEAKSVPSHLLGGNTK